MTTRRLPDGYELDDDPARVDVAAAAHWLDTQSYWAHGRDEATMAELVREAARVVGLYAPDGAMVGFARVTSDRHTIAYLGDVYVEADHRGRGLGVALVHEAIEHSDWPGVRWVLGTMDAHELYAKFGFAEPTYRLMERRRPSHLDEPTWSERRKSDDDVDRD
jgi:GNAT superfamily N-acetyltransferase